MEPRSPIFLRIKQRGPEIYKKACEYCKIHEKLSETREALNFNLRCKRNDLLPKSLRFRPPIRTPSGWAIAKRMGKQYLRDFIQDNHYKIRKQ